MKTTALILTIACLALTGCNKDRKCKGGTKPPPPSGDVQKVPDAPSGLQLSAIAAAAVAAYAVSTRKERVS
jgi:hypothetical protein